MVNTIEAPVSAQYLTPDKRQRGSRSAGWGEDREEQQMAKESPFKYEGSPDLRSVVEQALRWVKHPLLGLDIVDAGIVHAVHADDQCVRLSLIMTAPGCRLASLIVEDIEAELFDHLGGARHVEVETVSKPAWTPARMKVVPIDRRLPCQLRKDLIRVNMRGECPT